MTTVYLLTTESGERSVHTFLSTAHLRGLADKGATYIVAAVEMDPSIDAAITLDPSPGWIPEEVWDLADWWG